MALCVGHVQVTVKDISKFFLNKEVCLTDIDCISHDKGVSRAKIADHQDRRSLLSVTDKFKQSPSFGYIYVHRDLTFQQKEELRSRRAAVRVSGRGETSGAASGGGGSSDRAPAAAGVIRAGLPHDTYAAAVASGVSSLNP